MFSYCLGNCYYSITQKIKQVQNFESDTLALACQHISKYFHMATRNIIFYRYSRGEWVSIFITSTCNIKKGERKKFEGRNSHKVIQSSRINSCFLCNKNIYIVAIYVLRGIQTFTVDKAAMISSRQLLLLLYIYLSPPPRVPTFFYFTQI